MNTNHDNQALPTDATVRAMFREAADGGPAFPIPVAGCADGSVYNTLQQSGGQLGGMSLRDYFAATANEQIGPDASPEWASNRADVPLPKNTDDQSAMRVFWARCEAVLRYEYADAMLRAREVSP